MVHPKPHSRNGNSIAHGAERPGCDGDPQLFDERKGGDGVGDREIPLVMRAEDVVRDVHEEEEPQHADAPRFEVRPPIWGVVGVRLDAR